MNEHALRLRFLAESSNAECAYCALGAPHHPSAADLHVVLTHDGVRFVECTEPDDG